MTTTKTIDVLRRDTDTGMCRVSTVAIDNKDTPITTSGYEFDHTGREDDVDGWGHLSGTCAVWVHNAGAYEILIPARPWRDLQSPPTNLDDLLAAIHDGIVELDPGLPTWGDYPGDTSYIWSWDEKRELAGTFVGDLAIQDRDES